MYSLSHRDSNEKREDAHELNIIENQSSLSDMFIGMSPVADSGCEAIAMTNVMRFLGGSVKLSQVIDVCEHDGIVSSGKFGVSPKMIPVILKKFGYGTKVMIPTRKKYDVSSFFETGAAFIMTYYNNGLDLMEQIHTVAITKNDSGYTAHNVYCNGYVHGPFTDINDLIKHIGYGNAKPIMCVKISKN